MGEKVILICSQLKKLYPLLSFVLCALFLGFGSLDTHAQKRKGKPKKVHIINGGIGVAHNFGWMGGEEYFRARHVYERGSAATGWAYHGSYRYIFMDNVGVRGNFTYSVLGRNEKRNGDQRDLIRQRRLHFKSRLAELSVVAEGHILRGDLGSRFRPEDPHFGGIFGYVGLGLTYFNPLAEDEGNRYDFRLDQNMDSDSYDKSTFNKMFLSIPLGVGTSYFFSGSFGMGLELGYRVNFHSYEKYTDGRTYADEVNLNDIDFGKQSKKDHYLYGLLTFHIKPFTDKRRRR